MRRLLLGMAALGLCVGVTGQAKAGYTFTTLDPPGSIRTEAQGINSCGEIVGFYEDAEHIVHGFLLIGEEYTFFDVPVPGTTWTQGSGINDCGEIVGRYIADGIQHGYKRLSDGSYELLPDPPDGNSPQPYAINNSGQIVGWYDVGDTRYGFLLSGGKYTRIRPPGSTFTAPEGINNFGIIVGVYEVDRRRHGFVRLSRGRFIYPPDVPGSRVTNNVGINDLGQISGSYIEEVGGVRHGLVLEYGQYTTPLDPPDAVDGVFASGINASGWIVGPYTDAKERTHGYLAIPDEDGRFSRPSPRNGRSDSGEQPWPSEHCRRTVECNPNGEAP